MKSFGLFTALVSLAFLAACGGGGPANPGTGSAGFTTASFSGTYVFTMMGQCAGNCSSSSVIRSVGRMTADGKGNVTAGTWDLNVGGSDTSLNALTGTYTVATDGKVSLTLNSGTVSDSYLILLTGTTGGYIVSTDTGWALSGVVEQQTASAIAAQPAGSYVFQASGLTSGRAAQGLVGAMNLGAGTITADMNNDGTLISLGTGTVATSSYDNTTGRGLLTVTSGTLPAMSFAYYVVDANTLEFVSDDASGGMQGRAEVSAGAVTGALSGSFAFLSTGFPPSGVGAIAQVSEGGVFTGDGAGNVTSGEIDTVYDANGQTAVPIAGTGKVSTVAGATRDVLSLAPTSSSGISVTPMANVILWLSNSGRGFYLTSGTGTSTNDRVETGTVNVQAGGPYTDSGTFGFYQNGWAIQSGSASGLNYATLFKNANGTVTGYSQGLNLAGSPNTNTGTGTLTFDSSNVGQLTLNNTAIGTEDFRIYQYSPSSAFIMETDQGAIATGVMSMQSSQ